ncbi:Rhodanese-like domain-containing protein [Elsinoe ampelina]|uniref:Rhodanese-like domain-containing protein n=1 Tax=Elsinoe ampelina TaxID=302913 RepID=A0A6A6GG56_9PEZI|nr:Rhodanese-like domain-containing protein [Elsinoe ampelina]
MLASLLRPTRIPSITLRSHTLPFSLRKMSTSPLQTYLVSPSTAHSALRSSPSTLIPISAAWFLPTSPQTGRNSFLASHIPSSRFFDLDAISDPTSPYPHMLPTAADFSAHISALGIANTDHLLIYDAAESGLFSAPRVAWTFRVFGHKGGVHVLNNFKTWVEEGLPTEGGEEAVFERKMYEATGPEKGMVADFEKVRDIARKNFWEGQDAANALVVDARSKGRWAGTDPEPRKGLSSGHVPGSLSLPFTEVLDEKGRMKGREELRTLFEGKGIKGDREIVTSCGTGVTASVVEAALREAGLAEGKRRVYDGSWTEYAQRAAGIEGLIEKSE